MESNTTTSDNVGSNGNTKKRATISSYEAALARARELKQAGLSYPKIETELKKAGYVSARTHKPISAIGVRNMLNVAARKPPQEEPAPSEVRESPSQSERLWDAIRIILAVEELDPGVKIKLTQALMADSEQSSKK